MLNEGIFGLENIVRHTSNRALGMFPMRCYFFNFDQGRITGNGAYLGVSLPNIGGGVKAHESFKLDNNNNLYDNHTTIEVPGYKPLHLDTTKDDVHLNLPCPEPLMPQKIEDLKPLSPICPTFNHF